MVGHCMLFANRRKRGLNEGKKEKQNKAGDCTWSYYGFRYRRIYYGYGK